MSRTFRVLLAVVILVVLCASIAPPKDKDEVVRIMLVFLGFAWMASGAVYRFLNTDRHAETEQAPP